MPRVVHFEISAEDMDRAKRFYESVFDWQFQKWDGPMPYYLVVTGEEGTPGINGGMFQRHGDVGHVNTIEVEDLDSYAQKIVDAGGAIAVPKMPIPGVGWLCYCKDTEGSLFGLHQTDPNAS